MKHVPTLILALVVAGVLGFSAHLPLISSEKALAQTFPFPFGDVFPLLNITATTTTSSANVKFIKEIHRKGDIPYSWHSQTTPYHNIVWLSDGYFVAGGTCSPAVGGNNYDAKTQTPRAAGNNIGIQGGMYVFKDDGTFIKTQNVCYDGGIPGPGIPVSQLYCNEGAACETSMNMRHR
jgi:hypothetical protein